jgi:hypothetical protein
MKIVLRSTIRNIIRKVIAKISTILFIKNKRRKRNQRL